MTVLVFGKTGQIAQELQSFSTVVALDRGQADLTVPGACAAAIQHYSPIAVINAAAYTAVDQAEVERHVAIAVNGSAPSEMAVACAERSIPFVHISSDYVFNGSGCTSWVPHDNCMPLSAYGYSKLVGEDGVRAAGGVYAIVRTSWVFSAHGHNFVKTMLRLGRERDEVAVVSDQIGGPTPASNIAEACMIIAEKLVEDERRTGTYHFSGDLDLSWADFARSIFSIARIDCKVIDLDTAHYPTLAPRPLNSRLDCTSTQTVFGMERPNWRVGLAEVVRQLGMKGVY